MRTGTEPGLGVGRRVAPMTLLCVTVVAVMACGGINATPPPAMDAQTGVRLTNRSPYIVDVFVITPVSAHRIARGLAAFRSVDCPVPDLYIHGTGEAACIYVAAYRNGSGRVLGVSGCLSVVRGRMDNPITITQRSPSTSGIRGGT